MIKTDYSRIFPGINRPLLFAHRGCSLLAPENTLAAFRLLVEHQVPGVELDVQLSADGEVVVVHDEDLQRLCGYPGLVRETAYETISKLDAGSHFGLRFAGERIPRLSEVCELLGDKVYYDIELKTRLRKCGTLEQQVINIIRKYGLEKRVLCSSFNPLSLKALRKQGWTRNAVIYTDTPELPWYLRHGEGRWIAGCPVVKPSWQCMRLRPFYPLHCPSLFPVLPWVVDDPARGLEYLQRGAAGIITNNPLPYLAEGFPFR